MSNSDKTFKRKRFFNFSIQKRLQLRMLLKIWAIILASLFVTCIIFYFYSDVSVGKSLRLFHVKAKTFMDILFPVLVTGFFASLVLGVVISLLFPHSIAGPLYRIERELVDVGNGNLCKEISLRGRDELQGLADSINIMIKGLNGSITIISDLSGEIKGLAAKTTDEDSKEIINKIKMKNESLQKAISKFKL